jgi:predicted Ser/Thr protein kinase
VEGRGVIAYNLLTNAQYTIKQFKNVMYIDFATGYLIFKQTDLQLKEIDKGFLYSFYSVEGKLYDSFYTTDYKAFVKGYEQLRLDLGGER